MSKDRSTTQDITWFLDLYRYDNLELNPTYQRRSIWSPTDRRYFLDTIFRGYPSPSIYLHKQIYDDKTIYSVIDGKQRLETIFKFVNNDIALDKKFGDDRLANKKWKTIKLDNTLAKSFYNYVLPVHFIDSIDDTAIVNEIFDRLNRNSMKLVAQELRHAKYDGWFMKFVERESELQEWQNLKIVTPAKAKRMSDVQFLSELLIVVIKDDISGFDQHQITLYYAEYDNLIDTEIPIDEEKVKDKFNNTKNYLLELETKNNIVTNYAPDLTNMYSLWSVICLNLERLPSAKTFAKRYSNFMDEVVKFREKDYLEKITKGEIVIKNENITNYYQNSVGARTEAPQRIARNRILNLELFGK